MGLSFFAFNPIRKVSKKMNAKQFFKRNASTILTYVGGAGVITTSVLAVKATPKALLILEAAEREKGEALTKMEVVQAAGVVYIPPLLVGVSTLACIFGANILNKRQQAALTSAYVLLDSSFKNYKGKVDDLYGEGTDDHIREEIAKDQYKDEEIEATDDGKHLYYDDFSKRYFRSTKETMLEAECILNKSVIDDCGATVNEFYEMIGLDKIDGGDILGWSAPQLFETYWSSWVNFRHELVENEEGEEFTIIYMTEPMPNFEEY